MSTSAPSFPFLSQFLAMALVYAFVFAYHGATPALARWTALNFAQVLAEATAAGCAGSLRARWSPCGGAWRRRLHAAAAVPSWFFGALTLQYFFSGSVEIGDFFTERFADQNYSIKIFDLTHGRQQKSFSFIPTRQPSR